MDQLGMTSRWVAAAREQETLLPNRLFDDPFAAALAGDEGRAMLTRFNGPSGENPFLSIRTRFIDDWLLAEAARGIRQVVLLAAGMDARAFRLAWPDATAVFEVERPEVLAWKEGVLSTLRATPRARRVLVRMDLRDDWRAALHAAGHDQAKPSAILVEGLLPYLPDQAAAHAILSAAASLAAPGSAVAADVVGASFLTSPLVKGFLDTLAAEGVPWLFGTDSPEALFEQAGWHDVRAIQPGEVAYAQGRWPYATAPRGVPGVPRSFLVTARR